MGVAYNPKIVTDGLVLCLDAANSKSYSGSGSSIVDISGNGVIASLNGTYSYSSQGIRIFNINSDRLLNISHIQLSSITNITTVSLWYKLESISAGANRYLLDMRTGGSSGWIYNEGAGSNWATGSMYLNSNNLGDVNSNIASAVTDNVGLWRNIVVIANTPATDNINFFSRYTDDEGLDVTFGSALVYNRVLTQSEITQNFNALRGRFGI